MLHCSRTGSTLLVYVFGNAPPPLCIIGGFRHLGLTRSTTIFRALHGTLFLFGTDGYGFQEPRVQMVRGYGFHIIAVGTWTVPGKLGLFCGPVYGPWLSLRFGYGPVYDSFQVKSAGRFRSGLHSTSFFPNCDIFHAFNFRHACIHRFVPTLLLYYFYIIHRLPSSRLLCRLHILEALAASFLLRSNDGVVLLNLW